MPLLPPGLKGPAIVAALLTLGYVVTRKKPAKKPKAFVPPVPPSPEPPPEPPPVPGEKYVGTGWTDWPRKDLMPDERSLAQVLELLGYGGWGTCIQAEGGVYRWTNSATCKARVGTFQRDFNTVMKLLGDSTRLGFDRKMGPRTIGTGFVRALELAGTTASGELYTLVCTPALAWPGGIADPEYIGACGISWQALVATAEMP